VKLGSLRFMLMLVDVVAEASDRKQAVDGLHSITTLLLIHKYFVY
jgi:hypothetical protein